VSDPRLVRKPDGTIYLYFGGSSPDLKTAGAVRFASTDADAPSRRCARRCSGRRPYAPAEGATPYAVEAAGLVGKVDAVLNVGTARGNALWTTTLIPGLAAQAHRQPKPTVKVRDDTAPGRVRRSAVRERSRTRTPEASRR
jgi:hypothetical protein